VQELAGWKETDQEGPEGEAHAAADGTGNLTAERSGASAASADSHQRRGDQQQGQHPATPGSAGGQQGKDHAFVTPRTSFSCDPRSKGKGRFQSGSGSVCKDSKTLFGGASADDVGMTPAGVGSAGRGSFRACSEGGAPRCGSLTPPNTTGSAAAAAAMTPTPARSAAEGVEARILAKIASVCTPGPSAATIRKSMAHAAAGAPATDGQGRRTWQD
jgi:hypothetical protein